MGGWLFLKQKWFSNKIILQQYINIVFEEYLFKVNIINESGAGQPRLRPVGFIRYSRAHTTLQWRGFNPLSHHGQFY